LEDSGKLGMVKLFRPAPLKACLGRLLQKRECHSITKHEGPEREERYSSTHSLTLAVDVGGWLMPHPGYFMPGQETH